MTVNRDDSLPMIRNSSIAETAPIKFRQEFIHDDTETAMEKQTVSSNFDRVRNRNIIDLVHEVVRV